MTKEKVKSNKQDSSKKYKIIIGCLAVLLACSLSFCGYLFCSGKVKSFEEEKRLEVFDELARSYVERYSEYQISVEENDEVVEYIPEYGVHATMDGIGLSRDNELYIDFTVSYSKKEIPFEQVKTKQGREHFQSYKDENGEYHFSHAYNWNR